MSGSIKANKITARNVVTGVQIQGATPEDVEKLKALAATVGGDISAEEINAESVVSGLQILSAKTPASLGEFRDQLAELGNLVRRLTAATSTPEAKEIGDVQEMGALLEKSRQELAAPRPDAGRISRWLKSVNEIAANLKSNVTTFTGVAAAAKKLIDVVGSLFV